MPSDVQSVINREGIFGFGLSHNNNLDLLNIVVLACAGIIIKLFFQENYSKLGNIGPASSTIWGYGLTAIALSIMLFIGIYVSKNLFEPLDKSPLDVMALFSNVTPIFLTLLVIVYIIYLNFVYFTRINTNKVTPDYHTYSFMSSILIIVQILLISKYLFSYLSQTSDSSKEISKNATYILSLVNFIFVLMIHISLAFFSTDEISVN